MWNLKHTIVAAIAIVMISSLATTQSAQFKSAKADSIQAGGAAAQTVTVSQPEAEQPKVTVEVWHQSITEDTISEVKDNAANQSNSAYVLIHDGALNVHVDAGIESEVVDQLMAGSKVSVLSEGNGWYQIAYGNEGKTGYVISEAITASYDEAKAAALENLMYETGSAIVGEGALNIRSAASMDAEVVDQLDNGDQVIVVSNGGEWLHVYYGKDYNMGYVSAAAVKLDGLILREQVQKNINDRVAASAIGKGVISISDGAVNVRAEASENADVKTQLSNKTNVLVLSRGNGWTKIAYGNSNSIGYVKSEYVVDPVIDISRSSDNNMRQQQSASSSKASKSSDKKSSSTSSKEESAPAKASSKGAAIVAEAEKYLGVKYVYGGTSPSGFDCSGLVQYVMRKQGISVPRSSGSQFGSGVSVSRSNLQPGDLVFFRSGGSISHVGIYVGGGQMIHAPRTGKTVSYTSIDSVSRQKSFAGGRRVY
jgi:cell wall-associated NlpC family hydrolase